MKSLKKYIALLPFAFLLHNIEEVFYIDKVKIPLFEQFAFDLPQFIIAVTFFSILGFMLVFGKNLYRNERAYQYGITGFSGMLFLNAILSHILPFTYYRIYLPGIVTALLLTLPLSGYLLWKIYQSRLFSTKQLLLAILIGGVLGMALLLLFRLIFFVLS